jgi:hypothetical protein
VDYRQEPLAARKARLEKLLARTEGSPNGAIVFDHARKRGLEAAKLLGLDAIPTCRLSHLSDAEKRAYILADRVFKSFDDIVGHCCFAWNTLIDQPWKIMSIARRDWVIAGQSL